MTQFLCIIVCLFVSSYIVFSKGCILLSTDGCARGRIAFGGRLVLVGNDDAGVGDISRPLIFVTPFAFNSHRKLPFGFGRGQIWIGKRNCLGQSPQSHNNCPVDESRPCLDTTAPCFSAPPTFTQSEPLQFSDITETSLTVSWPAWNETTDLGVGPVNQYKLQYREEGAVFNDILLDAHTLQYHFDGLKLGRTYEFRITLIRDLPYIESQPSNLQKETTLYGAPPSFNRLSPLEFSSVTEDSVTVSWPAWNEDIDSGGGPVTQHKIQYRKKDGTFMDVLLLASIFSYRFDGLEEGTEYEFRIILMREHSPMEGQPSSIQTVTTKIPGAPVYIQDYPLSFSDVTNSSITVTWPEWDKTTGTGTGPITGYRIQFLEQGSNNTFPDIVKDSTVFSHKFDGLKEGTTYEFRIILISGTLIGTPSVIQRQKTPCGDLNDSTFVLKTKAKAMGKSRIIANWRIRELSGSCEVSQQVIKMHQLDAGGCNLSSPGDTEVESLPSGKRKQIFNNLTAYSNFNITLTVTHWSGVYTFSKIQRSAETDPTAAPFNVTVTAKRQYYTFRWKAPPCGTHHGKITKYGYKIWKSNESPVLYYTPNLFVRYPKNKLKGRYNFTVCACNSKGNGPFSNISQVDL